MPCSCCGGCVQTCSHLHICVADSHQQGRLSSLRPHMLQASTVSQQPLQEEAVPAQIRAQAMAARTQRRQRRHTMLGLLPHAAHTLKGSAQSLKLELGENVLRGRFGIKVLGKDPSQPPAWEESCSDVHSAVHQPAATARKTMRHSAHSPGLLLALHGVAHQHLMGQRRGRADDVD